MTTITQTIIRKMAYARVPIKAARAFGLSHFLRRVYYRIACPKDGILEIRVDGRTARFRVHTPEELRVLESLGGGEREVLLHLLARVPNGATVYDVGANVGLYSALMALAVGHEGRVVAFEPDVQNHRHLQENMELNQLRNVTCVPKALGDSCGEGRLVQGDVIGNYSLVASHGTGRRVETVEVVPGDEFAAAEGFRVPHFVKIDVEGFEYAVIRGLQRTLSHPDCRLVCVEVHPYLLPQGVTPDSVLVALHDAGFVHCETFQRPRDFHVIFSKDPPRDV